MGGNHNRIETGYCSGGKATSSSLQGALVDEDRLVLLDTKDEISLKCVTYHKQFYLDFYGQRAEHQR